DDPRQIFLAGPSGFPVCRRKASTAPAVGLVRRGRDHSSRSEGAHAVAAGEAGSPASPDDDLKSSPPCRPRYVHKGLTYILGLRLPAKARRRGFARNADLPAYTQPPNAPTHRGTRPIQERSPARGASFQARTDPRCLASTGSIARKPSRVRSVSRLYRLLLTTISWVCATPQRRAARLIAS